MNKIKILFINGGLMDRGGISSFICNYLKYFDFNKFEVTIAVHGEGIGQRDLELKNMGCKIINFPVKSNHYISWRRKIKELLVGGRFDIIHANADAGNGPLLKIAKQCKVKIRISHSHNTNFLTNNKIRILINKFERKQIIDNATHLFACSNDAGKWLYDKNNFEVIYNAIDYSKFEFDERIRNQMRKALKISDNQYVVGHVGRFDYQKNHKYIIELAERMKDKNTLFLLVGDGHLRGEIESSISEKKLKNVMLVGEVESISDYLNAMDSFIMPSLFEGLGMVLIEAQANGLYCIISDSVTKEVGILKQSVFLSIENIATWVDLIESNMAEYKYDRHTEINMNYNLEIQSNKLQEKYLSFWDKYYEN